MCARDINCEPTLADDTQITRKTRRADTRWSSCVAMQTRLVERIEVGRKISVRYGRGRDMLFTPIDYVLRFEQITAAH